MPAIAHENKILGNTNNLNELSDVNLTSPTDKQGLVYDAATGKWVNADITDEEAIHWSEATTSVKKNLLKNTATSTTINGITFTVNSDGSVTANGTATALAVFDVVNTQLYSWKPKFSAGSYKLSCENVVAGTSYFALTVIKGGTIYYDYLRVPEGTSEVTWTDSDISDITDYFFGLVIQNGQTVNNVTFYPMFRLASIADDTYEPYIPDNTEVMRYTDNAVLGAKNLFQNTATSQTEHAVTFTVNSDGTVNVSGTASGGNGFVVLGTIELKQGVQYILSGGVSGNLRIDLRNSDLSMWTNNTASQEVHSPKESFIDTFIPNSTGVVYVCARAQSGSTVSGTLYPMIRLATDTDDTYVPYAMTNRELTYSETVSATINTTNANSGNITIIRLGSLRIVTGHFNPKVAGTSATNVTIATVPTRDKGDAFALCGRNQSDSIDTLIGGLVRINTAGELKYQGHVTGANLFFNLVYTAR